jgi:amidase
MNRREFLHRTLLGSATSAAVFTSGCVSAASGSSVSSPHPFSLEEKTLAQLQQLMHSEKHSAVELVTLYLDRIKTLDQQGPKLKAVLELNPDALAIATSLDAERKNKGARGPLHGIPILIKDNIDTHDRMHTSAGSLALADSIALSDAFLVERLRKAGAVILGKTNLSEWANFRGNRSISGWSARGGQTLNPYIITHSPSGSSSGSAVAVSANMCAAAVGTETNGSIVSPSSYCGVVGLKPTVGLVSRSGIIPIAATFDTAGPMTRTVADAAAMLSVMTGPDEGDPATQVTKAEFHADYTKFLGTADLRKVRCGIVRGMFPGHPLVRPVFDQVITKMRDGGFNLTDNVSLPNLSGLGASRFELMLYEFKAGLNAYFASLGSSAPVKSIDELIAFNEREKDREMPYFGQEDLIAAAAKGTLTEEGYLKAKQIVTEYAQVLKNFMDEQKLDVLVAPTAGPAGALDHIHGDRGLGGSSTPAATAGFPHITVPCGNVFGLPMGFSFFGRAWSEPTLIAVAHRFEQLMKARTIPKFLPYLDVE